MPHNSGPITERRKEQNRLGLTHALGQIQECVKRAQGHVLHVEMLPKGLGDIECGDRAEILEYVEMLRGMVANLATGLHEAFEGEPLADVAHVCAEETQVRLRR